MTNSNLTKTSGAITRHDREEFLSQKSLTYWITGLSGAGKSTVAYALESALFQQGKLCYVLDGDNIRHGLNSNLGFSLEDRTENIRRIAEVSKMMNDAGLIVICASISPLRTDRELAKTIIGDHCFVEVYLNTPLEECEKRDPKGLYRKARLGQISYFTGISSPYEAPVHPRFVFDTSTTGVSEILGVILDNSI
jgi:adenylyl-sulfate kinase